MLVKLPLALALTFYASPKRKPLRKDCKKKTSYMQKFNFFYEISQEFEYESEQ